MDDQSKHFIYQYLNTASPTGFEAAGQQVWLDYVRPYIHEHLVDTYGTVVGTVNPGHDYKVVIEAHADEISWFVNYISPEGFIYIIRNGGSDFVIAPAKRVNIHTGKGVVKAVFGWPAVHVRDGKDDPQPSQKTLFLDCGCANKDEVEALGVHVGCVVTFEDGLTELNDRYYVGRALDNRMGGVIIAEVARRLHQNQVKLPYTLYVVNSVQEEIGLRGAEMIAHRLRPDVAICTDVTHDTRSPLYDKIKQGDCSCGKGPQLTYGPAVQNNLLNSLIKVAEEKQIPFQRAAVSRSTGTDTDAFAYSSAGVASVLVSLPLKYMHTTVEMVHKDDIEHCIQLIYEYLVSLPAGTDFRYLK
ncbi:MAG: M20/M25/M40 family metallo-hydrolase [Bernardetiaceae bacterium]|jgi:putative aminopeptidase FrvX|nr:M20/M25/M40 family metallo-hydrolase [Bernardetiaceae bacterium]